MATITNSVAAQLEQVSDVIGEFYSYDDSINSQLKPSKTVPTTRYLFRAPYCRWVGGTLGKVSMDGGILPNGSSMVISSFTGGYIDSVMAFKFSQEQIDTSDTPEKSRVDVVKQTIKDWVRVLNAHNNVYLTQDGTGKLTNAASAGTSTTLTFEGPTDTVGTVRLFPGMQVDVWDSTGATKRAGGPYTIGSIDANTVTFTAAPTGMGTTDLIAVYNLDVYGPSTLATGSSTWPGDALTGAAGLTGDSWRHGLPYSNDSSDITYYLLKAKASFPELKAQTYAAGGNPLTFSMGELIKNKLIQARDETVLNGLKGVMHLSNNFILKEEVRTIQNIDWGRTPDRGIVDLQPTGSYMSMFNFAGIPCFASKVQPKARVDFFNPATWVRVEGHPAQFMKAPDGTGPQFWPIYDGSGNQLTSWSVRIKEKFDWVNLDPGAGAAITGTSVAAGH